jgi:tetratricopeptide (TPR) repeat protein
MSARQALDGARPILARMDPARGPENTRSDLIEAWSAVETALRSLAGGSTTAGQALIRDARARQVLSFDQANALVAFLTVRERLDDPAYQPTESDVNAARSAFLKLDAGLMELGTTAPSPYAPGGYGSPAPKPSSQFGLPAPVAAVPVTTTAQGADTTGTPRVSRRFGPWWIYAAAAVVVIILAGVGYMLFAPKNGGAVLAEGIQAYQSGDKLTASSDFERAARANPDMALPHVYLARMAREVGNFTVAGQELQLALKAQPGSLEGRREYGSLFLAQGNYEQARVWYTHALEIDQSDAASQGWLGCTLVKLGRTDEGTRWLTRAGAGPWSACSTAAAPPAPRQFQP